MNHSKKILFYICVWLCIFLVLCIVSIIKHFDILMSVFSQSMMSLFSVVFTLGIMIYGILVMIRG